MSSRYGSPARKIWSLAQSGLGTAINAPGNSGLWQGTTPNPAQFNAMTPVDLRDVEDVWLTAMVAAEAGTTPSLTVTLNQFDDAGNAWPIGSLAAITATGIAGGKQVQFGKHGGSAASYVVFSAWGQVAWTVAGTTPSFTGVSIELWAR